MPRPKVPDLKGVDASVARSSRSRVDCDHLHCRIIGDEGWQGTSILELDLVISMLPTLDHIQVNVLPEI